VTARFRAKQRRRARSSASAALQLRRGAMEASKEQGKQTSPTPKQYERGHGRRVYTSVSQRTRVEGPTQTAFVRAHWLHRRSPTPHGITSERCGSGQQPIPPASQGTWSPCIRHTHTHRHHGEAGWVRHGCVVVVWGTIDGETSAQQLNSPKTLCHAVNDEHGVGFRVRHKLGRRHWLVPGAACLGVVDELGVELIQGQQAPRLARNADIPGTSQRRPTSTPEQKEKQKKKNSSSIITPTPTPTPTQTHSCNCRPCTISPVGLHGLDMNMASSFRPLSPLPSASRRRSSGRTWKPFSAKVGMYTGVTRSQE